MGYIERLAFSSPSIPSLLILSLAFTFILVRIARDPLRHIPGPLICRYTSLWLHYQAWAGTQCSAIQKLHEKYGPVVRIAPNDLHVSDGSALWPIYMEKGGFLKSTYYNTFDIDGHATVFTTLQLDKRAERLKAIQSMFSYSAIQGAKSIIERCATRMVERLEEEKGKGGPVDVLNLTRGYAIDAVSAYLLSVPYNGLEEKDGMSASPFVDFFVSMSAFFHLSQSTCKLIERIWEWVSPDPETQRSASHVERFLTRVVESKQALRNEGKDDHSYPSRLLAVGLEKENVIAECKDALFAGTDSTGNNLATILWYLVAQPSVYDTLKSELLQNASQPQSKDLQSLPYLNGVVKEALRLSMAISCRLPRVVPPGGFTFNELYIPPATNIGLSAFQLHLSPTIFPSPHSFSPERWINASPEMQRDFMPFGKGARACIARNLAMMELFVATEKVVRSGVLEGGRTVKERIESLEWFNSRVVGGRVELDWVGVEEKV